MLVVKGSLGGGGGGGITLHRRQSCQGIKPNYQINPVQLYNTSPVCVYVCVCLVRAEVVKLPAVKRTVEGRTLISTCAVVGEPEPTIEWRRTDRLHRHALGVQPVSDQHTHAAITCQGRIPSGAGVLTPRTYVKGARLCSDPLKCHILSFKTVVG